MRTICTIGYEGASVDAFVYTLGAASVDLVVDIREIAASRRPGFSKSSLQGHLSLSGIQYTHLLNLGNPKEVRETMLQVDQAKFLQIPHDRLNSPDAQLHLAEAIKLASQHSIALLCYEREPKHCQRSIVAAAM